MSNREDISIFNSNVLNALCDEIRQELIITLIKVKEMRAGDIALLFNVQRPTISHHLQILKRANIVTVEKRGKEKYYSINYNYVYNELNKLSEIFKKYKTIHSEG